MNESDAQTAIRLEAARKGLALWRNNVGAMKRTDGTGWIRFGLANDTEALNKNIKSGDLIGIRKILIRPEHVGTAVGQFVSREIKPPGWKYHGTDREAAQQRWINLVNAYGGDAMFATGEGTL